MEKHIFNRITMILRCKTLRRKMSQAEQNVWQCIRDRQLGVKFYRKYLIGDYIVDFYSPEIKLAIKLYAESDFNKDVPHDDIVWKPLMQSLGIRIVQLLNDDVMQSLSDAYQQINDAVLDRWIKKI